MKDGENENLSSFWIDSDDEKCQDNLMVTKSLVIKSRKILNSSCIEKYEDYKCWREYKGVLLNLYRIRNSWTLRSISVKNPLGSTTYKDSGAMVGPRLVVLKLLPIWI